VFCFVTHSANAEYIRMGDVIVDVPGGSNNHNYANVTLIVELARLHGVHAVWAGWGHASENPTLPDSLAKSLPPIKFIGPAGPPMRALGDKIGSTIIAQSAGVPCIGWNGQHVRASYDKTTGTLPEQAYDEASVVSASDALEASEAIGFPVMIKASEGGGGKGIRRVDKAEDVATAYRQVCGEVPGSPIFIMKLSSNSRHLEVQLLADEYGDAIALNGRDCSVQRRHQKIIEEGPPVAARPDVWLEMEKAAVSLAKAVFYTNAGTVEYLYSEKDAKFYFLELNPRLQVEHPVTEMITKVNLPAAQLQVAMGIPLKNIPEIRELYGRNRFEDVPNSPESDIDFDTAERVPPTAHCIAVRITAENAEAGFKPTSGGIQELNFRSTPNVWGYFSMDSSGSIHEFADSQFGHLFASGSDREHARRNMVLALKELSIRGDISTTVDYVSRLIELDDFVANQINTGWLDGIIKNDVDGFTSQVESPSMLAPSLHSHFYVVIGAAVTAYGKSIEGENTFVDLLEKGQLPNRSFLKVQHTFELILEGVKYPLETMRKGPNTIAVSIQGHDDASIETTVRVLSDGGYLIAIGGNSQVAYLTNKGDAATGMRMSVGGTNVVFSPDYDPTSLRTDVAGKLVKKLKPDGARVKKGEPYCEIEVMKMFMPLKVDEAGTLSWCMNEGAALSVGDMLAELELDNPDNVSSVSVFDGVLAVPSVDTSSSSNSKTRAHLVLRESLDKIGSAMSGYLLTGYEIDRAFNDLAIAVTSPMLPVREIEEQLSVLSARIPSSLYSFIDGLLTEFMQKCDAQAGSGAETRYVQKFSPPVLCLSVQA
jgi:acetyl-CoA carboxylase/biotin carboxylase 1